MAIPTREKQAKTEHTKHRLASKGFRVAALLLRGSCRRTCKANVEDHYHSFEMKAMNSALAVVIVNWI